MSLLLGVSEHPRASPFFQPCEISGVIQMSVRQENGFDRSRLQSEPPNKPLDEERFTHHPSVNHHARIAIFEQVATTHDAADGVEFFGTTHIGFTS